MGKKILALVCVLLLGGCAAPAAELPPPAQLYAAIESAVTLPDMIDASADEISAVLGVEPEMYDAAVYYGNVDALSPDEIIIIRAVDDANAKEIEQRLENRMAYKKKSAANYLPENVPMIDNGVIRRDGLTVSLLVSDSLDGILAVYEDAIMAK